MKLTFRFITGLAGLCILIPTCGIGVIAGIAHAGFVVGHAEAKRFLAPRQTNHCYGPAAPVVAFLFRSNPP